MSIDVTLPKIPFAKMNGAGNSILVVDERGLPPAMTGTEARRIARGPLGFDQMMVVRDPLSPAFDASIRIFNTDGSRAGACGNGTRCVAWMMSQSGSPSTLRLEVEGTDVRCAQVAATMFSVDMGGPRFDWQAIPLREALDTSAVPMGPVLDTFGLDRPAALSMGNPHAVFFVADAEAIDLARIGPRLEADPVFPDRANISFAQILGPDRIRLRVWERGAGATLACGSAACATLVAAARSGRTGRRASVSLPGGELGIDWQADDHVLMTGPVELERRGWLSLPDAVAVAPPP